MESKRDILVSLILEDLLGYTMSLPSTSQELRDSFRSKLVMGTSTYRKLFARPLFQYREVKASDLDLHEPKSVILDKTILSRIENESKSVILKLPVKEFLGRRLAGEVCVVTDLVCSKCNIILLSVGKPRQSSMERSVSLVEKGVIFSCRKCGRWVDLRVSNKAMDSLTKALFKEPWFRSNFQITGILFLLRWLPIIPDTIVRNVFGWIFGDFPACLVD